MSEIRRPYNAGFTLLELMIAVAIIGILASIAIPAYNDYLVKSRRAAAQSFLLQVASQQNSILLDLRRYVAVANNAAFPNAPTAVNPGVNLALPDNIAQYYNVAVAAANPVNAAPSFTVTATPIGGQAADTLCGALTINELGVKGENGTGTPAQCWK